MMYTQMEQQGCGPPIVKRCGNCHAGFELSEDAVLWLCPVCDAYGERG
jgi:hypothetical protein